MIAVCFCFVGCWFGDSILCLIVVCLGLCLIVVCLILVVGFLVIVGVDNWL